MSKLMRIWLASLAFTAFCICSSLADCPVGDLNGDCKIGLDDLQVLAEQWLAPPESPADLDGDDRVGLSDFTMLATNWHEAGLPLAINEVLAANSTTIQDPQYEYDDWIEIYNYGDEAINVGGMYLTDDMTVPTRWRIPDDDPSATTIQPHEFLLIWADNDTGDPGLHTNFELNTDGEELGLFNTDGISLIDSISFGQQSADISYGHFPDASYDLRLMAFPTPGGPNIGLYLGFVAKPKFSHDRGFYDAPFSVTMTTETEDALIYYTVDGTEPYDTSGRFPTGRVYTGPVPITKTTCLRARAGKFAWMSSKIETHTYIFVSDVITQSPNGQAPGSGWPIGSVNGQRFEYGMDPAIVNHAIWGPQLRQALTSIPTMSIVTHPDNLFDPSKGIYVNAGAHGRMWERPTSLELIYPADPEGPGFPDLVQVQDGAGGLHWDLPDDMRGGFQINAGLRIRGGYSRSGSNPKHAFRVFFRSEYGDGQLSYPLFGDEGVDTFDKVDLRTAQNYSWSFGNDSANTMCREVWARDTQGFMGQAHTRSRYYHLYINGHYWGIFQTQERPEAAYGASYFGGRREEYDAVKATGPNAGYTIEATDGTLDYWRELWNIANLGFADIANYCRAQGLNPDGTRNPIYPVLLDVDNLIDYMIMILYDGDRDAPISNFLGNTRTNNWYGVRNRNGEEGFRYFVHDAEHIMSRGLSNRNGPYPCGDQFQHSNPQWIHQELMANPEYRIRFADHAHKHLFNAGLLTAQAAIGRFRARAQQIDMAIIAESARWGRSSLNKNTWLGAINNEINSFFPNRSQVLLSQLKNTRLRSGALAPLYPSVDAPTFNHLGGLVPSGFSLTMWAPAGTIYYTLDGSDPRTSQTSGGTIGSTTLVPENAAKRVLVPTGAVSDSWRSAVSFNDSSWTSGVGGVGYERSSGYEAFISIDVEAQMYSKNATCYIRIPFTVGAELGTFDSMMLKVRYDDAFVTYINGVEVDRRNFTGTPAWNSGASSSHSDSEAVHFENMDISDYLSTLQIGGNVLAIQGMNRGTTGSDFLISVELVAAESNSSNDGLPTATEYTGPITLTETTQVKARALSGGTWSALNEAVFAIGPVAENLRITEIMYHPQDTNDPDDPNEEFIELQNIGIETINPNLVRFTNGVDFAFPSMELAAGEYVLVVKKQAAFDAEYPDFSGIIAGEYSGSLANGGERVELQDAAGQTILNFRYRDGWYDITDGMGFSLTAKDPVDTDPDAWNDKNAWRPSANIGGSPGWDDSGEIPALGSVKINELLAHAHAEAPDWIELHNTTGEPIHIGGWFLSDDSDDLMKYEIADGTWIDPCDYIVFYQNQHFGNIADPGCHSSFALSENGETLYLHSGRDGALTGYSEEEAFGASETDVAFGRYKKSTGTYNFVAMSENTPGSLNAYPKVGPVVINEIMYHPQNNGDAEYVELLNISGGPIDLEEWDNEQGRFVPWRFTDEGGISFDFPLGTTMAGGEHILLVRNLSAFESEFGAVGGGVQVFEWELGKLDNGSEKIQLSKPGDEVDGERYYIRVDRVNYSDGSHPVGDDPWPTEADGSGSSLSRIVPSEYGNDVINWQASSASPGE